MRSSSETARHRSLSPLAAALAFLVVPAGAWAQDADGDGVPNAADALPCDAARAAVSYYPAQGASALLVFEDQWPGETDLDFNDIAVAVHYRAELAGDGRVVQLHAVLDPIAVGGQLSNGLGLQLPVGRDGVTVRRRIGDGAWSSVALERDTNVTFVASANLRELYRDREGRLNVLPGEPRLDAQRLELEVSFATPTAVALGQAPFDLFAFRADDFGHQIHFPAYAGTADMRVALFGTDEDGSSATRHFVHVSGIPAALNLMTTTAYPQEGVEISALFPDIVAFASSAGASHADFYLSNVQADAGFDIPVPAVADAPADRSCLEGLSPAAESLSFAAAPTLSHTRTLLLSNEGTEALTIASRTLSGEAANRYTLTGCDSALVLAGGESCTLRITFEPDTGPAGPGRDALLSVVHSGAGGGVSVRLYGDASFTPAVPTGASGASPPSINGFTASWLNGASYGGYSVGSSFRSEGRFAVSFQGTAASLNAMEYNIQTTSPGTYYGVSFITGRIVRAGADIVAGSTNGSTFARPTLANNDRILMLLDFSGRSVSWHHCRVSTGSCTATPFHSVSNIVGMNTAWRVYSYKTGSGSAAVTLGTTIIPGLPTSSYYPGLPQ